PSAPMALAQLQLTITNLDAPGRVSTQLTVINNNGVISGYYLENNETGAQFTWQNCVFLPARTPPRGNVLSLLGGSPHVPPPAPLPDASHSAVVVLRFVLLFPRAPGLVRRRAKSYTPLK